MNIKSILAISLVCLFFSVLEFNLNEQLESNSSKVIEFIQKMDLPIIQSLFSVIGEVTSICFLILSGAIYLSHNRNEGFLCVLASYLGAGISGILKIIFTNPRPLWKYASVSAIACPKDWGSPSGHSMAAGTPLIVMILLWNKKENSLLPRVFLSLSIIITAIDRVYLGAHFLNQVILGYAFATLIASVLVYGYERDWFNMEKIEKVLALHAAFFGLVFVSITCFYYRNPNWEEYWMKNFEDKCKGSISSGYAMSKNMVEGLLGVILAGFVTGRHLIGNLGCCNHKVISFVLFWVVIEMSIRYEKKLKNNFNDIFELAVERYALGLFISAGLPIAINKFDSFFGEKSNILGKSKI